MSDRLNREADGLLPALLLLHAGLLSALAAGGLTALTGVALPAWIGPVTALFALESYLFTYVITVRDPDTPRALRLFEVIFALLLAKGVATLPVTGLGLDAITFAEGAAPWLGLALLVTGWHQGYLTAHWAGALHPDRLADPEQEQVHHNDHGEAFDALRARLLYSLLLLGALLGLGALAAGGAPGRLDAAGLGYVALAAVSAATLAVAAQLRQRITWAQEGLAVHGAILRRWGAGAGALILPPLLLALSLPAGPTLPLGRWLVGGNEGREVAAPPPTLITAPDPSPEQRAFIEAMAEQFALPPWIAYLGGALLGLAVLLPLAALTLAALRQLLERMGPAGPAGGLARWLWQLLRWYGSLWQALWAAGRGAAQLGIGAALVALDHVLPTGGLLPLRLRPPGEPRAAIRHYFARLQGAAGRGGLRRAPGESAAAFAGRLAAAAPAEAERAAQLARLYEQARYSPEPVTEGQAGQARRVLGLILKGLGRRR